MPVLGQPAPRGVGEPDRTGGCVALILRGQTRSAIAATDADGVAGQRPSASHRGPGEAYLRRKGRGGGPGYFRPKAANSDAMAG